MATESNSTTEKEREHLTAASLDGCYLETLLAVIEDTFEEIDSFCGKFADNEALGWIRDKSRHGLNITYMAQDKAVAINGLTNNVEKELWRADCRRQ